MHVRTIGVTEEATGNPQDEVIIASLNAGGVQLQKYDRYGAGGSLVLAAGPVNTSYFGGALDLAMAVDDDTGHIYLAVTEGSFMRVTVSAFDSDLLPLWTGPVTWASPTMLDAVGGLEVGFGDLFVASSSGTCRLDGASGALIWPATMPSDNGAGALGLDPNGTLYTISADHSFSLQARNPATGAIEQSIGYDAFVKDMEIDALGNVYIVALPWTEDEADPGVLIPDASLHLMKFDPLLGFGAWALDHPISPDVDGAATGSWNYDGHKNYLDVSDSGRIVVTGEALNTFWSDVFVATYDAAGGFMWSITLGGGALGSPIDEGDWPLDVMFGPADEVYVTGYSQFDAGGSMGFQLVLSPAGDVLAQSAINHDPNYFTIGVGIAIGGYGDVYFLAGNEHPARPSDLYVVDGDEDKDSVPDALEVFGFDLDNDGVLELDYPGMGLNPFRKDLVVEIDMMTGIAVPADVTAALGLLVAPFNAAPITQETLGEPSGIAAHFYLDETDVPLPSPAWPLDVSPEAFNEYRNSYVAIKQAHLGMPAKHSNAFWGAVAYRKLAYERYCMIVAVGPGGNLGEGERRGNDCTMWLGSPWAQEQMALGAAIVPQEPATFIASVVMHEVGHNLGLEHGGADGIGFKPNYHSVMNYAWIFPRYRWGVSFNDMSFVMDYSRHTDTIGLNEAALDEASGIGRGLAPPAGHAAGHLVMVGGALGAGFPNPPLSGYTFEWEFTPPLPLFPAAVDFNLDNDYSDVVQRNINCIALTRSWNEQECGHAAEVLTSQNDWTAVALWLQYPGPLRRCFVDGDPNIACVGVSLIDGEYNADVNAFLNTMACSPQMYGDPEYSEVCPCIDEEIRVCGTNEGPCTTGTQTCVSGVFGACSGATGPEAETCNAIDDDCDALTDDAPSDVGQTCGTGVPGVCAAGHTICTAGSLSCSSDVGPSSESCNARDDDCNGAVDNGYDVGAACSVGVGACLRAGTKVCLPDATGTACNATAGTPIAETCNGIDDDCDGTADEGLGLGFACDGTDADLCQEGTTVCDGSGGTTCSDATGSTVDSCNGLDDDCDPSSADGAEDPLTGTVCDGADSDLCNEGTRSCSGGVEVCSDATGSSMDVCNGLDDDCDASSADGAEDALTGTACDGADSDLCNEGTRACSGGVEVCSDGTGSTTDVCNGLNDDCDASSADGAEDPLTGTACDGGDSDLCNEGTRACTGGTEVCSDGTGSTTDVCNGLDDDCDGGSADGAEDPLNGTACDGPDSDLCNEGTRACSGGALACSDATGSTIEICGNAVDEDCDGSLINGCKTLTIARSGTYGTNGQVRYDMPIVTCGPGAGGTCAKDYATGTLVSVGANENISSTPPVTFAGWSGAGCSGYGACAVTMDANKTVTAQFEEGGKYKWSAAFAGNAFDWGQSIVDTAGNIVALGRYTSSSLIIGGTSLASDGLSDGVVVKYSTTGGVSWVVHLGGTGDLQPRDVAADNSGNVFVTGWFNGTMAFGANSQTASNSNGDAFVLKISAAGAFVWMKKVGGTGYDDAMSVAIDGSGNAVVAGNFQGTATFDVSRTSDLNGGVNSYDCFVAWYAAATGTVTRSRQVGGSGQCYATGVALNAAGSVVLVGNFDGAARLDMGSSAGDWTSLGLKDVFAVEYGGGIFNFIYLWGVVYGGNGNQSANALAIATDSSVIVVGQFEQELRLRTTGASSTLLHTSLGGTDIFALKLGFDGGPLWSRGYGATLNDGAFGVALDPLRGNINVVGYIGSAGVSFGGPTMAYRGGGSDGFLVNLASADAAYHWERGIGGSAGTDYLMNVATGSTGRVAVIGYFQGTLQGFSGTADGTGSGSLAAAASTDAFIGVYDP